MKTEYLDGTTYLLRKIVFLMCGLVLVFPTPTQKGIEITWEMFLVFIIIIFVIWDNDIDL